MRRYRRMDIERADLRGHRARTWRDAIGATCRIPTEADRFTAKLLGLMVDMSKEIPHTHPPIDARASVIMHIPKFGRIRA